MLLAAVIKALTLSQIAVDEIRLELDLLPLRSFLPLATMLIHSGFKQAVYQVLIT